METSENSISIKVVFFASTREKIRIDEDIFIFETTETTTKELKHEIKERYPALSDIIDSITLAVNQEYVYEDVGLNDGDEVALIPPLSGG